MLGRTSLLLVFLSISSLSLCTPQSGKLELKLVQMLTRHGDRTPLHPLPVHDIPWICSQSVLSHPSSNGDHRVTVGRLYRKKYLHGHQIYPGNCSLGQLTNIGCEQHRTLGQTLRQRYIKDSDFLSPELDLNQIYIRSTDKERTLQSAQCQLLGLYPPTPGTEDIHIIPIETGSLDGEIFHPNYDLCPKLKRLRKAIHKSPEWVAMYRSLEPLRRELCALWNITVEQFPPFHHLYDQLACRTAHGLPFPPGITPADKLQMDKLKAWEMHMEFHNLSFNRLAIGPVVGIFLDNIQEKLHGDHLSSMRYMLHSAHDHTIGGMLFALGLWDNKWPRYAANIAWELLTDSETREPYLRILYNQEVKVPPPCYAHMTPEGACPLKILTPYLNRVVPVDYVKECM
eukprot:gnl/Trimastix_PCT/2866.p1 GENE.gnl/Trimastix_PCT/2866~~gnl/Trimastix_PCT/2866.p1  ORF type:complete len:399 (-),score=67.43 gnl/Trimastix_PCT/2866:68-1264(-)